MSKVRRQLELSNEVAAELAGAQDHVLKTLEDHLPCEIFLRGNMVTLDGDAEAVQAGATVVRELSQLVERGHEIGPATIESVTRVLDAAESPSTVLSDVVWRHRNLRVAPKTVNQKRYLDAIRRSTVTFGVGPAGTGKTFLAMAMAASALSQREVNRIILTRPAVEAGERLGFLPGDLMAKVDPYLRPLFDALHDMMDAEKVSGYLEKGVIEVAPLAFMRGRAQPVDTPVLTPDGFRPIGELRVGDLVVGSDGLPTPVLGVFPQGRREVFRVSTQDGASTLACAEHLWHVQTRSDHRHGKPGRVLQTKDMLGRLRVHHQRQFELPMVAPVEFPERDVPLDPYALGLLLGDGCITTKATPMFSTRDPEVAEADGGGAVLAADPVSEACCELEIAGTDSTTAFIPDPYLHNSVEVRHALLQGLLDSDSGSVRQHGRTCRTHYTTWSARLRDDIVFVVRSLGGLVQTRTDVDAHMLDIRLPASLAPFRLARKRELYERSGGGRPMRFIDAIEPEGEAECVCISVAAPDSLYVTEDFLVTHNTLNDSFIILDEAQNTSPEQMKMFLTRLGFGSKVVVTGDITQIDLPRDQKSGLVAVQGILDKVEGVEFVSFGGEDVVRHKLVQRIVEAYDLHAAQQRTKVRPARRA